MRHIVVSVLLLVSVLVELSMAQPGEGPVEPRSFLSEVGDRFELESVLASRRASYGIERTSILAGFDLTVPEGTSWRPAAREYFLESCKALALAPDTKPLSELVSMGAHLIDELGCDDPLVRSLHATWLVYSGSQEDLTELFTNAINDLPKTDYPAHRIVLPAFTYAEWCEGRGKGSFAQRIYEARVPRTVNMLGTHIWLTPVDSTARAFLVGKLFKRLRSEFGFDTCRKLLAEIERREDNLDPYLASLARGICEYRLAWEARGDGFWGELAGEQRNAYREGVDQAIEHLLLAQELEPDLPYAAIVLTDIAAEGYNPGGRTQREWFEQAVGASFLAPEAYTGLLRGLQARWGGSASQTKAFAIELASVRRYDTDVPWKFFDAVEQLGCEYRDFDRAWGDPQIAEAAERVLRGYLDAEQGVIPPDRCRAMRAAVAWQQGRFADAYEDIGDPAAARWVSSAMAWQFRADLWTVLSDIYALGGPHAEQVRAAVAAFDLDDPEEADRRFDEIFAAIPADQDAMLWSIKDYRERAQAAQVLASGEWLTPPFDSTVWRAYQGVWETKPDETAPSTGESVWGSPVGEQMFLHLAVPLGSRAEFEGRIDLASLGDGKYAGLGFFFDHGRENYSSGWRTVMVWPNIGVVSASAFNVRKAEVDLPEHGNEIGLRAAIWDGWVAVWVDDQLVYRGEVPGNAWQGFGKGFGLTGWIMTKDAGKCSAVRVRRLSVVPDALAGIVPGTRAQESNSPGF